MQRAEQPRRERRRKVIAKLLKLTDFWLLNCSFQTFDIAKVQLFTIKTFVFIDESVKFNVFSQLKRGGFLPSPIDFRLICFTLYF